MSTALRAFVVIPVSLILFAFIGVAFAQINADEADDMCPPVTARDVYKAEKPHLAKFEEGGKEYFNRYGTICKDIEGKQVAANGICVDAHVCQAKFCGGKPCALPPIKVEDVKKSVYGDTPPPAVIPPPSLSDTGDVSGLPQNPVPPGTNQSLAEQALFNPTPLAEQKDTLSPSANSVGELLKRADTQPGVIDKIRDFFSPAPLNPNQDTFQLQPVKYDDFGNEIPQTVGPQTNSFTNPNGTFGQPQTTGSPEPSWTDRLFSAWNTAKEVAVGAGTWISDTYSNLTDASPVASTQGFDEAGFTTDGKTPSNETQTPDTSPLPKARPDDAPKTDLYTYGPDDAKTYTTPEYAKELRQQIADQIALKTKGPAETFDQALANAQRASGYEPTPKDPTATIANSLKDASNAFAADRGYADKAPVLAGGLAALANQESGLNPNDQSGKYGGVGGLSNPPPGSKDYNETTGARDTLANLAQSPKLSPEQQTQVQGVVDKINATLAAGGNPNKDAEMGSWLLAARQAEIPEVGKGISPMDIAAQNAGTTKEAAAIFSGANMAPDMFRNGYNPDSTLTSAQRNALTNNNIEVSRGQTVGQAIATIQRTYSNNFNEGIAILQQGQGEANGSLPAAAPETGGSGQETGGTSATGLQFASNEAPGVVCDACQPPNFSTNTVDMQMALYGEPMPAPKTGEEITSEILADNAQNPPADTGAKSAPGFADAGTEALNNGDSPTKTDANAVGGDQISTKEPPPCDSWMSCMREKVSNLFSPDELQEAAVKPKSELKTSLNCADDPSLCPAPKTGIVSWYNCGTGGDSGPCVGTKDNPISPKDYSVASAYPDNTLLKACAGEKCVAVVSNDKGGFIDNPKYSAGTRIADLTPTAFRTLADPDKGLDQGLIKNVTMTPVAIYTDYASAKAAADSMNNPQTPLPQSNPLVGGSYSYGPGEASGFDNLAAYNYFNDDNTATWAEVARVENLASNDSLSGGRVGSGDEDIVFAGPTATEIPSASKIPDILFGDNAAINSFAGGWEGSFAISAQQNADANESDVFNDFARGWEGNAAVSANENVALDEAARNDVDIAANDAERVAALAEYDKQKAAADEAARNNVDIRANDAERIAAIAEYDRRKAALEEEARNNIDNAANDAERRTALEEYDKQKAAAVSAPAPTAEDYGNPYAGAENVQTYNVPTRYKFDPSTGKYTADEDSRQIIAISGTKKDADEQVAAYDKAIRWQSWNDASIAGYNARLDTIRNGEAGTAAESPQQLQRNIASLRTQNAEIADASARFLTGDSSIQNQFNDINAKQANASSLAQGLKEGGQDTTNWDETKSLWKKGDYGGAIASGFGNIVGGLAGHVSEKAGTALGAPPDPYFGAFCQSCANEQRAAAVVETAVNAAPFVDGAWVVGRSVARVGADALVDTFATAGTRIEAGVARDFFGTNIGDAGAAASRNASEVVPQIEREIAAARPAAPDVNIKNAEIAMGDEAAIPQKIPTRVVQEPIDSAQWTGRFEKAEPPAAKSIDPKTIEPVVEPTPVKTPAAEPVAPKPIEPAASAEKPFWERWFGKSEPPAAAEAPKPLEPAPRVSEPVRTPTEAEIDRVAAERMAGEGPTPVKTPAAEPVAPKPVEPAAPTEVASVATEKPWYKRARESIFGKSEPPAAAETPKAAVAPEVTPAPKAAEAPAPRIEPTAAEPKAVVPEVTPIPTPAAESKSWWQSFKERLGVGEKPSTPTPLTQAERDALMAGDQGPVVERAAAAPKPAETTPPARGTGEPAPIEPVKRGSGDVSKPNAEIAMGDEGPVALKPGAENPSGKVWNDKTLTRDEFIADYKAAYPKTTLTDAQLAERYAAGKRLNPQTGQLKVPETPVPVAGTPAAPAVAGTPSLLSRGATWVGNNKIKTIAGLVVGSMLLDPVSGLYNWFTSPSSPESKTPAAPVPPAVAPPAPKAEVPPPPVVRREVVPPPITRRGDVPIGAPPPDFGSDYCIVSINPVIVWPGEAARSSSVPCYNKPSQNPAWRTFPPIPPPPPASTQPTSSTRPPVTPTPTPTPTTTPPVLKPYATLIANPPTVLPDRKSRLIWSSVNTSSCELFAPGSISMATNTRGSTSTLPLATTTQFVLNCSATSGATTSAQTIVTVH